MTLEYSGGLRGAVIDGAVDAANLVDDADRGEADDTSTIRPGSK
jgi:hypothetical protein